MEKKLQVRGLTVSFRTTDGKVQAVRNIDFDLNKGETLAIVGESGSGKSVTSKAILGILANNAMVEGGEIIYDGKDLLKISEEDFHRIRGDKIAMIFQDPMSSLNPIVKIGRQLTEAMILKGRARQRESRALFNGYLKLMEENMKAACPGREAEISKKCADFNRFEYRHLALESEFNAARDAAEEAAAEIGELAFEIEKNAAKDAPERVRRVAALSQRAVQKFVVADAAEKLRALCREMNNGLREMKNGQSGKTLNALRETETILRQALGRKKPDFLALGYYETFGDQPLDESSVSDMNRVTGAYLEEHFMRDFLRDAKQGRIHAADRSYEKKEEALQVLRAQRSAFEREPLDRQTCLEAQKICAKAVEASIDPMEYVKDSMAYTFPAALKTNIDLYFSAIEKNAQEEKRFARQTEKRQALVNRGKTPEWEVAPKSLIDLDAAREAMLRQIDSLCAHYDGLFARRGQRDYDAETAAMIEYLKTNASGVVLKVTKSMAREKAIRLMEEVGIPEPRKRYNQYPFEFSGGMRQRIVIAIALAADPDILICDEPTTALDVTIQSQILELINRLKKERHLSVIFITHDLGVVANMADRIAVMYAGKIVEVGTSEDVFYRSAHPYTWALLSSMPDLDTNEKLDAIPGTPPNMIYPPAGDAFAPRNKYALAIDFERQPPMFPISDTHSAATWLLHPDAPKVEMPKVITDRIARMKQKRGDTDAE